MGYVYLSLFLRKVQSKKLDRTRAPGETQGSWRGKKAVPLGTPSQTGCWVWGLGGGASYSKLATIGADNANGHKDPRVSASEGPGDEQLKGNLTKGACGTLGSLTPGNL